MKSRNMLRGVLFLLLMASGLGVFLSCKGISTTSIAYTVTFDAQGGSPVASIKAEQGKTIAKPADPAKGSFAFDGWYKESACTTPWNFATDTVTADITLYAKWKITIQFDASKIKCWRNVDDAGLTGTLVTDGGTVYEGDSLLLIAQPTAGKMADSWTVNGDHQFIENGNYGLYRFYNMKNTSLQFDYTEKIAEKVALQFDPLKIRCTKLYDQTPIMPGQRDEGDLLIFRTVDGSKVRWKKNGQGTGNDPQESYLDLFIKKSSKVIGNENVLEIDYE